MQGNIRRRWTTWLYRIDFGKIEGKRWQIEKGGYKKEADKALADVLSEAGEGKILSLTDLWLRVKGLKRLQSPVGNCPIRNGLNL